MIPRRLGGGDEAYYTYVEEADDDANKGSAEFGIVIKLPLAITLLISY